MATLHKFKLCTHSNLGASLGFKNGITEDSSQHSATLF